MNESVLKTDQIGRLRYTSEQKQTMVDGKLRLSSTALALLLDGIDMRDGCQRPWYEIR